MAQETCTAKEEEAFMTQTPTAEALAAPRNRKRKVSKAVRVILSVLIGAASIALFVVARQESRALGRWDRQTPLAFMEERTGLTFPEGAKISQFERYYARHLFYQAEIDIPRAGLEEFRASLPSDTGTGDIGMPESLKQKRVGWPPPPAKPLLRTAFISARGDHVMLVAGDGDDGVRFHVEGWR